MDKLKNQFRFNYSDIKIDISHIENVIGSEKGENRELVRAMIGDVLANAAKICDIKAEYTVCREVSFIDELKSLRVNDIDFSIGKIIWGQIRKSDSVAFFLCTAGEEIGELSRKLMKEKDFLTGYIYDVAGSEIVEAAADLMQSELKAQMGKENSNITNRFSPGYCGWNVSEQQKLFRVLPGNYCGITLTESSLMNPIKSVSGVIGIGENVKFRPYTCNLCNDTNCIYRRMKDTAKQKN
jgi:hypothetical protein